VRAALLSILLLSGCGLAVPGAQSEPEPDYPLCWDPKPIESGPTWWEAHGDSASCYAFTEFASECPGAICVDSAGYESGGTRCWDHDGALRTTAWYTDGYEEGDFCVSDDGQRVEGGLSGGRGERFSCTPVRSTFTGACLDAATPPITVDGLPVLCELELSQLRWAPATLDDALARNACFATGSCTAADGRALTVVMDVDDWMWRTQVALYDTATGALVSGNTSGGVDLYDPCLHGASYGGVEPSCFDVPVTPTAGCAPPVP